MGEALNPIGEAPLAFRFWDRIFGGGKGSMNQVRVYVGIVNNVEGFVYGWATR